MTTMARKTRAMGGSGADRARAKWRSSGLSDEHARQLGYRWVDAEEAKHLELGFHAGLLILYRDTHRRPVEKRVENKAVEFMRLRILDGSGKPGQKYAQPKGTGVALYLPHLKGLDWPALLSDPASPIYIVEGELKAAALASLGYAAVGLGGKDNWESDDGLLPELAAAARAAPGRAFVLVYDSDVRSKPQVWAARDKLGQALIELGARVLTATPPPQGADKQGIDDYLVAHGPDAVKVLLSAAEGMPERAAIIMTGEYGATIDAATHALTRAPNLYQRGGRLVTIDHVLDSAANRPDADGLVACEDGTRRAPGAATIGSIWTTRARYFLSQVAIFQSSRQVRPNASGFDQQKEVKAKPKRIFPPTEIAQGVVEARHWPGIPLLEGVVRTPVLLPSGQVLTAPGYHAESGLYYAISGLGRIALPEKPTQAQARQAVTALLEVVCDFPFASPHDRSVWLAGALTPFCRHALGPDAYVPLFAIDANQAGAGKGKLCHAIGILATGSSMAATAPPADNEEMRKHIISIGQSGDSLVLLDNIPKDIKVDWAALDAALTSNTIQGRLLGRNDADANLKVRLVMTWFVTGNNLKFGSTDILRRLLRCRLDAATAHPETRTGFKHPNLEAWVRKERTRLVTAALTVLRAYEAAGRPDMKLSAWGSFDEWSAIVRGALVWAGQPDPAERRLDFADAADADKDLLAGFLEGMEQLRAIDDARGLTIAEMHYEANPLKAGPNEALAAMWRTMCEVGGEEFKFSARRFAVWLENHKDAVAPGEGRDWTLKPAGKAHNKSLKWKVVVKYGAVVPLSGARRAKF